MGKVEHVGSTPDGSDAQLIEQLQNASDKDEALRILIHAAEASIQALKLAKGPDDRSKYSSRSKRLLFQAENIKSTPDWRSVLQSRLAESTASASRTLKEPVSTRTLTKREQILLLKASYLNSCKLPPWSGPPNPSEFDLKDGEELFLDETELPLSDFQEDVLDEWKRPADALPPPSWIADSGHGDGPTMTAQNTIDLVQDAATNCSVVASLCAAVARAEKGHGQIIRAVIHPYDTVNGHPSISPNGKYIMRLNFNGCYRRVTVDDRLPTSSTARIIHVIDRSNPRLLWPALVEKAYLKVRGGYDFPGSNSGTDLWILTGWIPEQVFLQSDDLEPESLWERVSRSFTHGNVLITIGTPKMSCSSERELGLASEHDYAVLNLKEVDGQRLLLVKNPWYQGRSWRGKASCATTKQAGTGNIEEEAVPNPRDLLNADDQLSPGTFWMDMDNVLRFFESMYLNWHPGLFAYRQDAHFAWDLTPPETGIKIPRGPYASLSRHPQWTITPAKDSVIWVLLCRHFQNAVPADATEEDIASNRYGIELSGYISLNAFHSNGRRVLMPERAVEKGPLVDSPQTLLKLDCRANQPIQIIPAEQGLPAIQHVFTISAFSNSPLEITEARTRYAHAKTYTASWGKETAGGCVQNARYTSNPQFLVTVSRRTGISILLESAEDSLNVHFKLVHSNGKRLHTVRNIDIVVDSKAYRRACCHAELAELDSGQYVIICSTFEAGQYGNLSLLIESDEPVQVAQLPREGAGRLRLQLENAVYKAGKSRLAAQLRALKLVTVSAVLQHLPLLSFERTGTAAGSATRSAVHLSIEIGRGSQRHILAVSNGSEFSDYAGSVRLDDVDLKPEYQRVGEIWLVLDRIYGHSGNQEERMAVDLFVDRPDAIAVGPWQECDD